MRHKPCYWVLVALVLAALVALLKIGWPSSSSDRVVRRVEEEAPSSHHYLPLTYKSSNKEVTSFARKENDGLTPHAKNIPHARNRLIFKGRPSTPLATPRSLLTFLVQPTSHTTSPMQTPLHFFHTVMKSAEDILSNTWVTPLKNLLAGIHVRKQVSVVFSNSDYLESVLNWLIAAKVRLSPPITNVMVLCLDLDVYDVLSERHIPSLHVDPSSVANTTQLSTMAYKYTVWMVRFVIFRLVNHWGYDVVSYDADAVLLRNPQELFEQHRDSDLVSSAGKFPFTLSRKWGFTVCMGVILFRSNPRTELLWESFRGESYDDQVLLNHALDACKIDWKSSGKSIAKQPITGQCHRQNTSLRVTVLPHSMICRYNCVPARERRGPYVWHELSKKISSLKKKTAKEGHVWFLKENWSQLNSFSGRSKQTSGILRGTDWLTSLSVS